MHDSIGKTHLHKTRRQVGSSQFPWTQQCFLVSLREKRMPFVDTVSCQVLFELTEMLALEVGFGPPTSDPTMFCLKMSSKAPFPKSVWPQLCDRKKGQQNSQSKGLYPRIIQLLSLLHVHSKPKAVRVDHSTYCMKTVLCSL